MEKTCTLCNENKDAELFIKDGGKPSSWCRQCYRQYVKDKGYAKYSNRREYYVKYAREYRKTFKNKKYEKSYRTAYLDSFKGTISKLLSSARTRAKRNDLSFDLDREWVELHLSPLKCEATGVDLTLEIRDDVMHSPFRPSIDRRDNNCGYTKNNCQIVCVIYNKAKSDYGEKDVLLMAEGLILCRKL